MNIAIMQPYFYPYLGYYELIHEVDLFVLFSEVQYTRGWINRNRIKSLQKDFQFLTVPIRKAPQKTPIDQIEIFNSDWHQNHLKTIRSVYPNAKQHELFVSYSNLTPARHLDSFLTQSLIDTKQLLSCKGEITNSRHFPKKDRGIEGPSNRIIDICLQLGATQYTNLPGGRKLYSKEEFARFGIELKFLTPKTKNMLSVIDACLSEEFLGF